MVGEYFLFISLLLLIMGNDMSISEKEKKLFKLWSVNRKGFVFDGVVSEPDYLESGIKLCFVLKEVNDIDGGDWDLRKFIHDGGRWQTWDNVTRWVKCIRSIDREMMWEDLANISLEDRQQTLRSICAMNLKKSPGGHTTERASFVPVVVEDKLLIQQQYALYNPDITICCGTGWDFHSALDFNDGEVFKTSRGIEWFLNRDNRPVIIYSHPAARVHSPLLVYGLLDAVREIRALIQ
ncbi:MULTISPECIES: hypothetical protein [Klebsiella/Raoultella group]|uniref:hypothetical protein n=2 Tax=Enterobacteriaceae TaxID=543 RepID=UPI0018D978B1|nr:MULTISPECIES: hypothetical protein [Klebsiella/Raoultella group]ELT0795759.1 hypothetical protein [Klebsiella quasipneumoniae]